MSAEPSAPPASRPATTLPAPAAEPALPPIRSRGVVERLRRNPRAMAGATIVALLCLIAVFAPLLAPYPPEAQVLAQRYQVLERPIALVVFASHLLAIATLTGLLVLL